MDRDERDPAASTGELRRLDALAYLLDNSIPIPGTGRRVGLDALIGLVPGVGDAAGALLSSYIVVEGARLGAPPAVLLRMVLNVGVEAVAGALPFAGDLFDAWWKANDRNVRLLRRTVRAPDAARRSSLAVLVGVLALLLVVLGGAAVLAFLALQALVGAL
ncbi:MAG TPA: DUF4112 domain-containing protein [Longimicrobiaceae bacterium]|nr:DUF4112 domain-containing protein [Longimicrobiaceae bacterium]